MKIKDCIKGVRVREKNDFVLGQMRVIRVMSKKESGTTFTCIEVEHSSDGNFDFCLLKRIPVSHLKLVK